MKTSTLKTIFLLFFLLLTLSSCAYVVHRELKHQDFAVQYPNWKNYQLNKYEDDTFKAITVNNKNTCNVLVSAYTTGYLTVAQVILDTIAETPTFILEEKKITYNSAELHYTNAAKKTTEKVIMKVLQCGEHSYVVQYSCAEKNYEKYANSRETVFNSLICTAPYIA